MSHPETRHLRVLIANERKDRLALVAPIVAGLGHEVIAREVDFQDVRAARSPMERKGIVDNRNEDRGAAFDRFHSAKRERDARAGDHEVSRGSNRELPAFADLLAAEDRLAAREAWLKWTERND